MNVNPHESIEDAKSLLAKVIWLMSTPAFMEDLGETDERDMHELISALLGIIAFMDDSISNGRLGSLFDRSPSPLTKTLESIASDYGTRRCYASTNGTSALNASALCALAGEGEVIAIQRDSHASVYGGNTLNGAKPVYLQTPFDQEGGVRLPPTPEEVADFLDLHRPAALLLTLPTYHGLQGDLAAIIEVCRTRGVRIMVDEAHGGHYRFLGPLGFPKSAEEFGADLITQSTHKEMSTLNQGSLLHVNDLALAMKYEVVQGFGFQSTSFSYPILASIEFGVSQMVREGVALWTPAVENARYFEEQAQELPGVRVLGDALVDGQRVTGRDPTRVTLNVRDTGLDGYRLADVLESVGIFVEMATPDALLFLVGPGVRRESIDLTLETLNQAIEATSEDHRSGCFFIQPPEIPPQILTPRQAWLHKRKMRVPKKDAIGQISAETIGCYPPGQPVIVAGEQITPQAVAYLTEAVELGGHLKRAADDGFETIEILTDAN